MAAPRWEGRADATSRRGRRNRRRPHRRRGPTDGRSLCRRRDRAASRPRRSRRSPSAAAASSSADALAHRERRVDEDHQLRRQDPERGRSGPVGDEAGDEEPGDAHLHRRVEHERGGVAGKRPEAEQREDAVEIDDGGRLQRPERPRLDDEAGEDRERQHRVGGQPTRTREEPEGGVVPHARPTCEDGAPSAVTTTCGRSTSPPRKRVFAATSASAADAGDDGDAERRPDRGRPVAGSIRWCMLLAVAAPAPPVAARGRQAALRELERHVVGDADGPRAAADGEIAAGVDEAGPTAASCSATRSAA